MDRPVKAKALVKKERASRGCYISFRLLGETKNATMATNNANINAN